MKTNGSHPTVIRTERGLTISGTRITLYDIMGYLESGWPQHLIQQWLNLTEAQSAAAFACNIEEHRVEVEAEYQVVLAQAKASRADREGRNQERLASVASLPMCLAMRNLSHDCCGKPNWPRRNDSTRSRRQHNPG